MELPWEILLGIAAIGTTIIGSYFAVQKAMSVAIARLEARFEDLQDRVEKTEHHREDIAVLRSQIGDARAEIATLRIPKHNVGNVNSKVDMLVSLLSRSLVIGRAVSALEANQPNED